MKVVVRSTDAVLLSFAESILVGGGLVPVLLDRHMSFADGSIGALPQRLAIPAEDYRQALRLMDDAGLGDEIASDG